MITRERALRNLAALTSPTAAEHLLIDSLLAACGQAIERHCNRVFSIQPYDELYGGNDRSILCLRNIPIVSVERVAFDPTGVLQISNASQSNQRASVQVTTAGVKLTRVASGVTTLNTLAFASYATLSSLATAITALANGWSATVVPGYEDHASADLRATQGAFHAIGEPAELMLHVEALHDFEVDAERGYLMRRAGVFHGGIHHWRIVYTAGFETIPEPVQEACAEWTAALFWQSKRDPNLTHESIPGALSRSVLSDMPAMVRTLLRPYRLLRL